MSRMTWLAPEGRFFDTGLDRGVLYPRGTPAPKLLATNLFKYPSFEAVTTPGYPAFLSNSISNPYPKLGTTGYSAVNGATMTYDGTAGEEGIRAVIAAGGTQDAGIQAVGVGAVAAGQVVTYSAEFKATTASVVRLSVQGATVTAGAVNSAVTAISGGQVKRIDVTVTHIAAGTPAIYFLRSASTGAMNFLVRKVMQVNTNVPVDYFDGSTATGRWNSGAFTVSWAGAAQNSVSSLSGSFKTVGPATAARVLTVASNGSGMTQGINSMLLVPISSSQTGTLNDSYASFDLLAMGLQEGKTYTVRAVAFQNQAFVGAANGNGQARSLFVDVTGGGGANRGLAFTNTHPNVPGLYTHVLTFTVPKVSGSPVTSLNLRFYHGGLSGEVPIGWDEVTLVEGNKAMLYFDGGFSDDGVLSYDWVGVANQSASIKSEAQSLAVPWTGLTGCEEQGGDGAASYYIDGRPFLFLPKPKEYQATLKAYTYPDAFTKIMGVSEIADGMYLDSQPGEVFDLSYRTLVGSATEGVDHAYKIHLVYNAVVTPQSLSYDTLGSSINPTEFSWDIQAVPVKVDGFRPTAHIIIDTRHMSPGTIQQIEDMLYGSTSTVAGMPTPQTIFDLLSFGDTIIVTDMGDGTFTVEGSYDNVYMLEPGVFRVDNIDGTNNADGTFTISSTNV